METKTQSLKSLPTGLEAGPEAKIISDPESDVLRILILEDVPPDAELMERELQNAGIAFTSRRVDKKDAFLKELEDFSPDIVLSDYMMPQFKGIEALDLVKERFPSIPLIIVTGSMNEETAIECMKAGGADYVTKEHLVRLGPSVRGALEKKRIREEKEKAEEKVKYLNLVLRESEERYRTLVESSSDAILMLDRERKMVSSNQAFLDLFGYEKNEVEGRSIRIIHQSDDSFNSFGEATYPMIENAGNYRIEWEFRRKDGTILPAETVTSAIKSPDGSIRGYVGIIRDITERKQAEREKKELQSHITQAQKMESIGTLAGGIAHDFNNILSAIIGYTELTREDVAENANARRNLDEVLIAGKRARDLVKQILTFSRETESEIIPLQPHLIIKETLKLLRSTIPTTVEIRQNINTFGKIMADPTQLHQVIMNLCTNAHQVMLEEGGILEIKLSEVDLDQESASQYPDLGPGPYIMLTVTDTGHGIDRAVMERIFDPYFTTKEIGRGTGLGLSVVHGIVKSYKGAITVYSEPGKGTTFHVYFPRLEEMMVASEPEAEKPLPTGNEHILFNDDDPTLVDLGRHMLERLGYSVTSRTSSLEALELFRKKHDQFDLVITDMTMPNMTGDKLAQELMKIRADIPIILCTGFSERITEEKAKGMGIRAFAMKPLVMRELGNTVRSILDE